MQLTSQQQDILNEFVNGQNLVVAARAGCGKTTMALELMWRMEDVNTLVLMFNKKICEEWSEKTAALKCVVPHTLDSFVYHFYDENCTNDFEGTMANIIALDTAPKKSFRFERLIVDEAQDFNPMTIAFLKKVLKDNEIISQVQFCIFGDVHQCIYQFRSSNNDLLLKTNEILHADFKDMLLSKTFRCAKNICDAVNKHWQQDLIQSGVDESIERGELYSYFINMNDPDLEIMKNIASHVNNDTMILCGSVQSDFFATTGFVRQLVRNNLVDVDKISCTTIHRFKGLEADTIILLAHRLDCQNVQYVGMTRAIRKLIIVQDVRFQEVFSRCLIENTMIQACAAPFMIKPFQFSSNETIIDHIIEIPSVQQSTDSESTKTALLLKLEYHFTRSLSSLSSFGSMITRMNSNVSRNEIQTMWNLYHNALGIQKAINSPELQRKFMSLKDSTSDEKIEILGQLSMDVYSLNDCISIDQEFQVVSQFLKRFEGAKWKFFTTYNAHEKYGSDIIISHNRKDYHIFLDLRDTSVSERKSNKTHPSIWIAPFLGKVVYSNMKNL